MTVSKPSFLYYRKQFAALEMFVILKLFCTPHLLKGLNYAQIAKENIQHK